MKRITSLALALLMLASMLTVSFTSASAAVGIDFDKTGSITLTKFEEDSNKEVPVTGAVFTAFRVFDLLQNNLPADAAEGDKPVPADEGTFKVTKPFEEKINELIVADSEFAKNFKNTGYDLSQGTLFKDTDDLEKVISQLTAYILEKTTVDRDSDEGFDMSQFINDCFEANAIGEFEEELDENNNATGKYYVDELPLGVYLVVETVVPEHYNTSTASFLVSIPEWVSEEKATDDGNTIHNEYWKYDITASPKDAPVAVDKAIVTDDGEEVEQDSYSIGEKVPFRVTSKIPYYGLSTLSPSEDEATEENPLVKLTSVITDEQYSGITYEYTDTFSEGLAFNYNVPDDFKVYFESDTAKTPLVPVTSEITELKERGDINDATKADYKLEKSTKDGKDSFVLTVAWEALDAHQGENLVLEYSATLDDDAVTEASNPNKVSLKYTSNPELMTTNVVEDDVDVFTYEMHLDKTFNGKEAEAAGITKDMLAKTPVTFRLTANENAKEDSDYIPVIKVPVLGEDGKQKLDENNNPVYVPGSYIVWDAENNAYAEASTLYDMNVAWEAVANKEGDNSPNDIAKFVLKGLEAGTYYLEETATVEGFGKLQTKVKIVVKEQLDEATNKIVGCTANSYINGDNGITELPLEKYKYTIIVDGDEQKVTNEGSFVITINNVKKQFNLPQTGGLGLWIFTIAGGIVMAGAIIFFAVIRKKKRNQ